MVNGIITKEVLGNTEITTVVVASREGLATFTPQKDVIERRQGLLSIDESKLTADDYVVTFWSAKNSSGTRYKTTVYTLAGSKMVEESTITLPSGTVVDKDAGVQVV